MAKGKSGGGVQNRAIYSRISFLQQAAVTLSSIGRPSPSSSEATAAAAPSACTQPAGPRDSGDDSGLGAAGDVLTVTPLDGMGRRLATDLRAVSLKTRIRLTPAVKQTICKFCDSVLIEGQSCTSIIENKSRGAKKPWADMLVRRCHTCGREKRYPVGAPRQRRKTERAAGEAGSQAQKQKQTQQG